MNRLLLIIALILLVGNSALIAQELYTARGFWQETKKKPTAKLPIASSKAIRSQQPS